MQNKNIEAILPELPDTYFWRIGKSGNNCPAINSQNHVLSTINCVFLSIRQNKKIKNFKFSIVVETKNLIYVGENLNRLKETALTLQGNLSKKLGEASGGFEVDLASDYVGDYQRSQRSSSAVLEFFKFDSSK